MWWEQIFKSRSIWVGWVLVLILGFSLRFWRLGLVPVGTYWDETAIWLDAKTLASTGHDIHGNTIFQAIFPSYGDYKLPVYIWLATASVAGFGSSSWAVRLPSALAGLGSLVLIAVLWQELISNQKNSEKFVWHWGGLIAAAILAISPWSLQFSRTAFEGHVGQFLLGISVWLLLKARKNWWYGPASAVFGGLAVYSYYSVRFVWPVLLMTLMSFFWLKQLPFGSVLTSKWYQWLKFGLNLGLTRIAVMGLIFLACLWPLVKSPLAREADQFRLSTSSVLTLKDWPVVSNQLREQAGNHIWDRVFYHRNWLLLQSLLVNYSKQFDLNYLFFTGDPNLRHGTGQVGLFYWWLLPSLLMGSYWWLTRRPLMGLFLFVWWLIALLPASVPTVVPHALRSLNALLPITLILAAGVAIFMDVWLKQIPDFKKRLGSNWSWLAISILIIGVIFWNLGTYLRDYYGAYAERSAVAWQGGYADLAQKIISLNQISATTWIETKDEKFYLWLMLLLDQSAQSSLPKLEKNYLFTQIGPYQINQVDWKAVVYDQTPMLVVMPTEALNLEIQNRQLQPSWIEVKRSYPNSTSYSIAAFRWPSQYD